MREIRFRFWTPNKRMLDDHYGWIEDIGINESLACSKDYGYIVMQFTGLKDKNGKDIYEGDIVKVDNSGPDELDIHDVLTECKWDNGCFVLEDIAGGHWTRQLFHQRHRLTTIGNIYENPELLK